MKIKYNLDYNYLNIYDEMQGIYASKYSLYRNKYANISSYTKAGFKFIKYAIIEFVIMVLFNILPIPLLLCNIINFLFAITVGGIVSYYVIFFSLYTMERNRSHRGELTIDGTGILDVSEDGVKIGIPWHYIECMIVTDNIICFISKVVASFVITVDHYDEVIEAVNKYRADLTIIEKRYKRNLPKVEVKEEINEIEEEKEIEEVEAEKIEKLEDIKEEPHEEIKEKKTRGRKKKDIIDRSIDDVEKAIKELTED